MGCSHLSDAEYSYDSEFWIEITQGRESDQYFPLVSAAAANFLHRNTDDDASSIANSPTVQFNRTRGNNRGQEIGEF